MLESNTNYNILGGNNIINYETLDDKEIKGGKTDELKLHDEKSNNSMFKER